ncbi:MAG: nucleotide exchange factor GrpE, partial [Chloroflexota bacterium]
MTEQSEKETQHSAEEQATTAEDGVAEGGEAERDAMNAVLQEKEELRALLQRVQADFVNYRNRVNVEREEIRQNAKKGLALRLLEVVDQFDDALANEPPQGMAAGWLEGFQAIRKNLLSTLASEGIQPFESEGQPFD